MVILLVLTVGAGLLYSFLNRKNLPDARYEYSAWISALSAISMVLTICFVLDWGYFSLPLALAVCLYALNKHDGWSMPFYPVGILGTALGSIISTYIHLQDDMFYYLDYKGFLNLVKPESIVTILLTVATLVIGFIIGEKSLDKNKYQSIFCYLGGAGAFIALFSHCFESTEWLGLVMFGITFAQGLVMLVKGATEKNYFNLNVGLVMLLILMFFVLSAFDWNMVTVGLMFLISGASLFGANFCIAKKIKILDGANDL
jgi:hypothetical protein